MEFIQVNNRNSELLSYIKHQIIVLAIYIYLTFDLAPLNIKKKTSFNNGKTKNHVPFVQIW